MLEYFLKRLQSVWNKHSNINYARQKLGDMLLEPERWIRVKVRSEVSEIPCGALRYALDELIPSVAVHGAPAVQNNDNRVFEFMQIKRLHKSWNGKGYVSLRSVLGYTCCMSYEYIERSILSRYPVLLMLDLNGVLVRKTRKGNCVPLLGAESAIRTLLDYFVVAIWTSSLKKNCGEMLEFFTRQQKQNENYCCPFTRTLHSRYIT